MNKNDKELLEYAAKAAGYHILGEVNKMIAQPDRSKEGGFVIRNSNGGDSSWNPLLDDGDALRLVVKLKLRAGVDASYAFCYSHTPTLDPQSHTELTNDAAKDLRQVIVNVASEIGKAIP